MANSSGGSEVDRREHSVAAPELSGRRLRRVRSAGTAEDQFPASLVVVVSIVGQHSDDLPAGGVPHAEATVVVLHQIVPLEPVTPRGVLQGPFPDLRPETRNIGPL